MIERESEQKTLVEEEAFMVERSGEIPEVAMHSSLHYLTCDPEGPGLELGDGDLDRLRQAVADRYRTIILRDLESANRDRPLYRGLARSAVNWSRCRRFCRQAGLEYGDLRLEVAAALQRFLGRELAEVFAGRRLSSVNCTAAQLAEFCRELGLTEDELPSGWRTLCP